MLLHILAVLSCWRNYRDVDEQDATPSGKERRTTSHSSSLPMQKAGNKTKNPGPDGYSDPWKKKKKKKKKKNKSVFFFGTVRVERIDSMRRCANGFPDWARARAHASGRQSRGASRNDGNAPRTRKQTEKRGAEAAADARERGDCACAYGAGGARCASVTFYSFFLPSSPALLSLSLNWQSTRLVSAALTVSFPPTSPLSPSTTAVQQIATVILTLPTTKKKKKRLTKFPSTWTKNRINKRPVCIIVGPPIDLLYVSGADGRAPNVKKGSRWPRESKREAMYSRDSVWAASRRENWKRLSRDMCHRHLSFWEKRKKKKKKKKKKVDETCIRCRCRSEILVYCQLRLNRRKRRRLLTRGNETAAACL